MSEFDVISNAASRINLIKEFFPSAEIVNSSVLSYTGVDDEYEKLTRGAGIRDLSNAKRILSMEGKDVLDYLHRVSTNDFKNISEFQRVDTLFTNEKGRIIDQTTFISLPDNKLLVCNELNSERLIRWLNKFIITEDINVKENFTGLNLFELIGPQAASVLTLICGSCINELNENKIITSDYDGNKVYATKFVNGESTTYWLMIPESDNKSFMGFIEKCKDIFDIGFVGEKAYEIYRVENGIVTAPNEINDSNNPYDLNLTGNVSFTKGCYIGQEVIARIDTYDKAQKELSGFLLSEAININGEALKITTDDDEDIGKISSICYSRKFDSHFGIGVIKKKFLSDGNDNELLVDGNKILVSILKLPL